MRYSNLHMNNMQLTWNRQVDTVGPSYLGGQVGDGWSLFLFLFLFQSSLFFVIDSDRPESTEQSGQVARSNGTFVNIRNFFHVRDEAYFFCFFDEGEVTWTFPRTLMLCFQLSGGNAFLSGYLSVLCELLCSLDSMQVHETGDTTHTYTHRVLFFHSLPFSWESRDPITRLTYLPTLHADLSVLVLYLHYLFHLTWHCTVPISM